MDTMDNVPVEGARVSVLGLPKFMLVSVVGPSSHASWINFFAIVT